MEEVRIPCLVLNLPNRILARYGSGVRPENQGDASLLRYADDLLVLDGDRKTADRDLSHLSRWLDVARTPLKASPGTTILDLDTGRPAEWLGFSIRRQGGGVTVETSGKGWDRLCTGSA